MPHHLTYSSALSIYASLGCLSASRSRSSVLPTICVTLRSISCARSSRSYRKSPSQCSRGRIGGLENHGPPAIVEGRIPKSRVFWFFTARIAPAAFAPCRTACAMAGHGGRMSDLESSNSVAFSCAASSPKIHLAMLVAPVKSASQHCR